MIDVALFSTGAKTIIGVKTSDGKINILPVDSLLIFQDPELVVERLLLTLEIQFGIQSTNQISKMYFAIPGTIKYDTGQIYRSFNFDKITLAKSYSGYSFKKSFGRIIKPENVYVLNDAQAVGLGVSELIQGYNSAIVFLIDRGVGASLIDEKGVVHESELGGLFIPKELSTPNFTISGDAIYNTLYSGEKNIFHAYTKKLISTVIFFCKDSNSLIKKANKLISGIFIALGNKAEVKHIVPPMLRKVDIKNVFIWSVFEEFIDKNLLKSVGLDEIVRFPKDEYEKFLIPILGCFKYHEQLERQNRKIVNIDYMSNGRAVYKFDKYLNFEAHWQANNSFANPENEYHIHFSDGFIKTRKMGDISSESDLEEFKF